MPTFKPAYLIHGDDHGRIAERRARLRGLAESLSGAEGLELFEGDEASPEAVALALDSMTLALGRRFIIVDGAERWKDKDLDALQAAIEAIAPDTTVAFFAREDSRSRAPERLHALVSAVGGEVSPEVSVKPWELPKWVIARGREQGIELDPDAARALIRHVGERQQRLLRELEKLSLGAGPDADASTGAVLEPRRRPGPRADGALRRAQGVGRRGRARGRRPADGSRGISGPARARRASPGAPVLDLAARCASRTGSRPQWRPASRRLRSSASCECRRARPIA